MLKSFYSETEQEVSVLTSEPTASPPSDNQSSADVGTVTSSTPVGRGAKRLWPGGDETDRKSLSSSLEQLNHKTAKPSAAPQKKSVSVYTLDSPGGGDEPGCSAQLGEVEAADCSYSSPLDADLQLVQDASRQSYYGAVGVGAGLMEAQSPSGRAEMDLSLTWTKQAKGQMSFAQFHQNDNMDAGGDAFGLKLVSVSGSTSTDCQLSESSGSAFDYDDADVMSFGLYGAGRCQPGVGGVVGVGGVGARGKRFICSICNKTYATSQNLDVHMRIHTGERPFSCSQCGKKFTQSAHLKSHLSVHSGERPYACALCSRSFIVKYSLKLHMKKCHGNAEGGTSAVERVL